MTKAGY